MCAGGAARGIGRRHGGDARVDPPRRQRLASHRAADVEPTGRPAHRRGLRGGDRDLRGEPRRIRPGAALHRGRHVGRDSGEGRGLLGSDVLAHRKDWKVIGNPFDDDDPIVLLPAIRPDVALFHAPLADREGNVWIGRDRELATMAHAAAKTVVTVEKVHDGSLFDDHLLAAGALGGLYVEAIALVPNGAWPLALADHYGADAAHLGEYARMAASADGFAAYLDRHVYAQRAA